MKKDLTLIKVALFVIGLTIAFILTIKLLDRRYVQSAQIQSETSTQIPPDSVPAVQTNSDGSMIIEEKGASFVMVPSSTVQKTNSR